MAKAVQPEPAEVPVTTITKKQCPCGATVFQGPFVRGEIVDGEFKLRETLYQCVRCNRVAPLDQLQDLTVGW